MKIRGFEKVSRNHFMKDCICEDDKKLIEYTYNQLEKPKRATAKSAGNDCFSPISFKLNPSEEIKLPTGVKAYMQNNEVVEAYPRSGHGFKYYIRLANTVGVIDADYYDNSNNEGHIWIKLRNEGNKTIEVKQGEAICQFIFKNYLLADGDSFTGDDRVGGIGSTNKS